MSARLAAMAQEHYQEFLPEAYRSIKDPDAFFARLGADAQEQIDAVAEGLRGPDPDGETFADRMARFNVARSTAESEVIREMILKAPEPQAPTTTPAEEKAEAEVAAAYAGFTAAVDRYNDLD